MPTKQNKSLQQVLEDPDFKKLSNGAQKKVLTNYGVSDQYVDKLIAKSMGTGAGTPTPASPGAPVPPFMTRVQNRIGGSITMPLKVADAAVKDITAGKNPLRGFGTPDPEYMKEVMPWGDSGPAAMAGALTYPARKMGSIVKDWTDPANLVGDVASFMIAHEAGGGEETGAMKRAAKATSDTVEHAAKVEGTAQSGGRMIPDSTPVEAHLQDLTPAERGRYDKLSPDQKTKFKADWEENQSKHGQRVRTYEDQVREARDTANRQHAQQLHDYAETESTRRAEWARKQYNYDQAQYEQVKAQNRKAILELGSREYTRLAKDNLQATHTAVREALDTRWNKLRVEMQNATVDNPGELAQSIKSAEEQFLRGAPQSLQQFRNLIRELGIKDFAEREDGTLEPVTDPEAQTEGDAKPLPWETARVHYSAIGDRLASGNLPGNVYQALKSVHNILDEQLGRTAENSGRGVEYDLLKQDWTQYMKDWKDTSAASSGGSPLARALRSPDSGYVYQQVTGAAGDRMIGTLAKYRQFGANPDLLNQARTFGNEAKALKVPSVKGSAPAKFAPGEQPELTLPKGPEFPTFKRTPVPEPEAPAVPRALRVLGRVGGKVAGGAMAGLPGYAAGGEIGETAISRWWEARHPKPGI